MAYARRRSTRRTTARRRTYSARPRKAARRPPVPRRVSARGVRKSGAPARREQVVRIVVQHTNEPSAGFASNNALRALGIDPGTAKPKSARIGSNN